MAGSPFRSCKADGTYSGNSTTCNSKYFNDRNIEEYRYTFLAPKLCFFSSRAVKIPFFKSFKCGDDDFVMAAAM